LIVGVVQTIYAGDESSSDAAHPHEAADAATDKRKDRHRKKSIAMAQPKKKYEPTKKYLAIKNWEKLSAGKDRKGRQIRAWYKDQGTKDFDDPAYSGLTLFQRGLFDAICRCRCRSGVNISSDAVVVARSCCVLPEERHNIGSGLTVLVLCGLLIATNQQFDSSETQSESESETEEETETHVPPLDAAVSPLPSGETKPKPDRGVVAESKPTPKPSTDLRDWSESIPGCPLEPRRIADCIRYQLDVKKNDYFIKRLSRGFVLKQWKAIVDDTPEDYVYDPDPLFGEKTIHVDGEDEPLVQKFVRRKPRNEAERRQLQKTTEMVARNAKWLYADSCPYGCNKGLIFVSDNPDAPIVTQRMIGHDEYCKCIGE
jgi:hypothetical protein